jgi:hypothetical protein
MLHLYEDSTNLVLEIARYFVTLDGEMDALRRSSRISRKERIRYVTIRQQIGLKETIIKEIGQNSLHGTSMFREW